MKSPLPSAVTTRLFSKGEHEYAEYAWHSWCSYAKALSCRLLLFTNSQYSFLCLRSCSISVSILSLKMSSPPAFVFASCTILSKYGNRWVSARSEEHTSELQSRGHLVCRLLLE